MNQQKRKLIAWSPHSPTNFVVGSNDLRLFEVKFKNGFKSSSSLKFSMEHPVETDDDKKTMSLLSINSEIQFLKCLAWSPDNSDPNLIAAGLASGKAVLTSFSSVNRITKEFVPRHSRSCNAIAWNPFYKNQLACGLDKVRGDFSTLVWDVTLGSKTGNHNYVSGRVDNPHTISQREDNQFLVLPQEAAETVIEPLHELANSETTLAIAWVPNMPSCLAAGTGVKWLRIYDLRGDLNAPKSVVAHAKSVAGVCFDYFDSNRLATFSEDGIVKIWDLRKLVDPTLIINTNAKAIQQIDWCPTRAGVLATIFKEGNGMKIWDVKEYINVDPARAATMAVKPSKTYFSPESISSFAWHPTNECRMLTISPNAVVETVSLNETIPLTFSPHFDLSFSFGTHVVTGPVTTSTTSSPQSPSVDKSEQVDISVLMKQRALQGYSANVEENKTMSFLSNDKGLQFLWGWASTINSIVKKKPDAPAEFPGVFSLLFDNYTPPPPTMINWGDGGHDANRTNMDKSGFFPVYKSPQRSICLEICGWGFGHEKSALEVALLRLEREGEWERAAALAVFHMDVRRAVVALNRGSSSSTHHDKEREFSLRLVAMALAGFSENQASTNHYYNNSLWRDTCMSAQYKHPYLSACFGFLCNDIQSVLENTALSLRDRIAVALRYLNNDMLLNFIERTQQATIEAGDLAGVILVGLTTKGVDLFQKYIDRTGDVQTASLAMGQVVPALFRDARVSRWIAAYRDLLDNWQLWHERALLDIRRGSPDTAPRPQVYARCNYCNQSLSLGMLAPSVTGRSAVRGSAPATKHTVNSCPGCKKPLPRCSLCLLPLTCSLPTYDRRTSIPPSALPPSHLHSSGNPLSNPSNPYGKPSAPQNPLTKPPPTPQNPLANSTGGGGEGGESRGVWSSGSNSFDEWFSWCQTCRHGGHAKHMLEWFAVHAECPVTDCTCRCFSI